MNKTRSNNINALSIPVCVGVISSLLISMVIALVISFCISNEYIEFKAGNYIVIAGHVLSAFAGSIIATGLAEERKLFVCLISCGVYYLTMLAISMLLWDGVDQTAFTGLISCAIGCAAAIFVNYKWNSASATRKRKRHSR